MFRVQREATSLPAHPRISCFGLLKRSTALGGGFGNEHALDSQSNHACMVGCIVGVRADWML
jgi:hypothetical protein